MGSFGEEKYIESQCDVQTFLEKLKHTLDNSGHIVLQRHKSSEKDRPVEYTNRYTINDLFLGTDIVESLKNELKLLKISDYLYTVKDVQCQKKSPLRVFAKEYNHKNTYIKIRVEILHNEVFVLSFHYAMYKINAADYPYKDLSLYGYDRRKNDESVEEVY